MPLPFDESVYPILTENLDLRSGSTSGSANTDFAHLVQTNLRNALGWKPRPDDPRGFTAALTAAIEIKEQQGRIVTKWLPRSFAVQASADLGAVTGAQASILALTKNAVEQALLLLNSLTPLRTDADKEDIEASREIVQGLLNSLVEEIATVGGPRVQRVDNLFEQLLGTRVLERFDLDAIEGQLGQLRDRFGFGRDDNAVNTLDEEQTVTNFYTLANFVANLRLNWRANRNRFDRGGDDANARPFFGPRAVHLSRTLALIAETVVETTRILDSVFINDAQRQATWLVFKRVEFGPRISLGELLEWVARVATIEGPRLVQNAGRDGLGSLRATLGRLYGLLRAANVQFDHNNKPIEAHLDHAFLPEGYLTRRAQRPIGELASQVFAAYDQIETVGRGVAENEVDPILDEDMELDDSGTTLTMFGDHFARRATLTFRGSREGEVAVNQGIDWHGPVCLQVTVDLTRFEGFGDEQEWTVEVVNPNGRRSEASFAFTYPVNPQAGNP